MTKAINTTEQRARDALVFDPLPPSPFVTVSDDAIVVTVNYSEALSSLLRGLPGAKWIADRRYWTYPFTSGDRIRLAIADINRLGAAAKQRADVETNKRITERAARQAAADTARAERHARDTVAREREMLRQPPRPFRREYLVPTPGEPVYHLAIEAIGDDVTQKFGQFGFRGWSGWVAQLFGSCPEKRFQRAFLKSSRSYEKANATGSRGVRLNYFLESGPIYEVYARTTWRASDRYFCRIVGGHMVRMTEQEVRECLEK